MGHSVIMLPWHFQTILCFLTVCMFRKCELVDMRQKNSDLAECESCCCEFSANKYLWEHWEHTPFIQHICDISIFILMCLNLWSCKNPTCVCSHWSFHKWVPPKSGPSKTQKLSHVWDPIITQHVDCAILTVCDRALCQHYPCCKTTFSVSTELVV